MSLYFAAPPITMTTVRLPPLALRPILQSVPPPDPAAAAEAQLQNLLDQQHSAELAASVAQAQIPTDAPPWGLYIGVGVGVLALISGVMYLRKRSKR